MKSLLLLISFILFTVQSVWTQELPIANTTADRDRLVRLETKVEGIDKRFDDLTLNLNSKYTAINSRFSEVNNKIDRRENKFDSYFIWDFGLVLMSIFGLIGFVIYDRRTTLAPVESKTERIIKALKEASEKDPALREALKRTALW
ncbi:MAG: hypothetical protein WCJ95_09395 [Mariniphaga sp.]